MTRSVRDIVASVMGTREGVLPSIQAFPPLDLEEIARELRLDERAKDAGGADLPPSDAKTSDTAELDITAEIERRARKAQEDYLSQLSLYEGRIKRAVITGGQRVEIDAAGNNAIVDFKARIIDDQNHLHVLREEVRGREEEYRAFIQRHGLKRLPKIASRGREFLALLILGLFVVAESILNGMFFAEGSEAGLIGGVVQAFVLSLLNVGNAFLYSVYILPLLSYRGWGVKALGFVASFGFLLWVGGLNLTIGHFRDLFIENAGRVQMADLLHRLSTTPWILADARSGLLVLLGIGLAMLAVIDGTTVRDSYPGFGAVGREREEAIGRYAEEKSRCLDAMTQLRNQAVDDMTAAIALIRNAAYERQVAVEGRSRLHHNYLAFLNALTTSQERLIRRYREGNGRARAGSPPKYFSEPVPPPGFLAAPDLAPMPEIEVDVGGDVVQRIERHIKALNDTFEETLPKYETVGQLTAPGA